MSAIEQEEPAYTRLGAYTMPAGGCLCIGQLGAWGIPGKGA